MEFLGVGPLELLVILVITLLVVGPQRLPEIAAQMGRFMRTFQRYTSQVTREFSETMRELEREYDEVKGDWRQVGQGLDESARSVNQELEAAGQDARLTTEQTQPTPDGPQAATPPR
jgi:sec-independent protein translocase protein TatB